MYIKKSNTSNSIYKKKHWNKLISWHALNIPITPNEPLIIFIYKLHQKFQIYVINQFVSSFFIKYTQLIKYIASIKMYAQIKYKIW